MPSRTPLLSRRNHRGEQKKSAAACDGFSRLLEDDADVAIADMRQLVRRPSAGGGDLLDFGRQRFPDASDLVLALEKLLEEYAAIEIEAKRAQERKKIEEAVATARGSASRKHIQGGINAGVKVRVFSSKAQLSPKVLRDLYRGFLDDDSDGLSLYRYWVSEYGLGRRHALVDFISAVLISDIHSLDPSCSSVEFGSLLGRSTRLRLIRSSDALIVDMLRDDKLFASQDDRDACLLKLLFDILDSPFEVENAFVGQLGTLFASLPRSRRAVYLQRVRHAFRQLAPELFIDEQLHVMVMNKLDEFAEASAVREKAVFPTDRSRP